MAEISETLLIKLAQCAVDPAAADRLRAWAEDDASIAGWDVLDLLRAARPLRIQPAEFAGALAPCGPGCTRFPARRKRMRDRFT